MSKWPISDANINAVLPSLLARCTSAPFCDRKREVESDWEWRPVHPLAQAGLSPRGVDFGPFETRRSFDKNRPNPRSTQPKGTRHMLRYIYRSIDRSSGRSQIADTWPIDLPTTSEVPTTCSHLHSAFFVTIDDSSRRGVWLPLCRPSPFAG